MKAIFCGDVASAADLEALAARLRGLLAKQSFDVLFVARLAREALRAAADCALPLPTYFLADAGAEAGAEAAQFDAGSPEGARARLASADAPSTT